MTSFEMLLEETSDLNKIIKIIEASNLTKEEVMVALQHKQLVEFNYSISSIKQIADRVLNSPNIKRNAAFGAIAGGSVFGPLGALVGATAGALSTVHDSITAAKVELLQNKVSSVRPSSRAKDILEDGEDDEIVDILANIERHKDLNSINSEDFMMYVAAYREGSLSREDKLHLEQIVTMVLQNKIQHLGKLL